MYMNQGSHPCVPGVIVIIIQAVTKIVEVEMLTAQDTSSDEVVNGCYNLFVIRKLTLNYFSPSKQMDSPCGVDETVDDEDIVIDVTIEQVTLLKS